MTQYTAFLLLAPIAAIGSAGVLVYVLRRGVTSKTKGLLLLMVSVIGWLVFNSLELISPTPSMTVFWTKVSYPFISATPVAWLIFSLHYTDNEAAVRSSWSWLGLLIPSLSVLLLWTNEHHAWVWRSHEFVDVGRWLSLQVDHGPWFYVYAVYSYALVFLGALLIIHYHLRMQRLYRQQSRWLVAGGVIPIIFNVTYVFDLVPGLEKDFTSIGFALSGLAFAIGIFRHRLFDLRPIARAALIDNMSDIMVTVDNRDRVIDLNPAAVQMLAQLDDATSQGELLGRPITEVMRRLPAILTCLNKRGSVEKDVEVSFPDAPRSYECRIVQLIGERGRVLGRLVVLHEITHRKRTEASLRRRRAELEARNEQLDAFARTVAHDLKGPLNTLLGYGRMIERYYDRLSPGEIFDHLASLIKTGERMSKIIESLLLLSQVYQLEDVAVDILDMETYVDEAVDQVTSSLSLALEIEIDMPETWPWIVGYGPWIVEIWVNYITNAIKYGGVPPCIELGFDSISDADEVGAPKEIRFWVRDEGPGLTEEQQQRLFKPFVRLHPTRADGSGLGLTIVKQIVEKLGGCVGVDSEPGEGCTFWFTLPSVDAALWETSVNLSTEETRVQS